MEHHRVITGSAPAIAAPGRYDRAFYSAMAVAMGVTVLVGFAPTYYLRFANGGPETTTSGGPFSPLIHVHGALFTTWIGLFIIQTALVARRRIETHRRLGVFGVMLAASMFVVGIATAVRTASLGLSPAGLDPLTFLAIPVFDMVVFATFVSLAVVFRRNAQSHKRLMLLAYVALIPAAVARWPGVLPLGPPAFYGFALIYVIVGAAYDRLTRGAIHRAYVWGGLLFVLSVPLRLAIAGTTAWRTLAEMLTK